MYHLIFCHGFAYTSELWQPMADYFFTLNLNCKVTNLDLGFFNTSNNNDANIFIANNDEKKIWISHSYGLIYGLNNYHPYINKYLAINPVLSFKRDYKHIKAMINNIYSGKTIEVLNNFYTLCSNIDNYNGTINNYNKDALIKALQDMLNFNFEQSLSQLTNICLLEGGKDIFLQLEYTKKIHQNSPKHIIQNGQHLLPLSHFEIVKQFIEANLL